MSRSILLCLLILTFAVPVSATVQGVAFEGHRSHRFLVGGIHEEGVRPRIEAMVDGERHEVELSFTDTEDRRVHDVRPPVDPLRRPVTDFAPPSPAEPKRTADLTLTSAYPNVEQQRKLDTAPGMERVVYNSYRPAGWDIYLQETSGGESVRLTGHPALDYSPTLSADARWIVFTSERDGNPSLYVLDREQETSPRRLIRSDAMQDQADLSPDGRWMVFVSTHGGDADIYRLPFRPEVTQDIADAVNLTRHPGGDFRPAISPDGERIAFSSDRDSAPSRHPTIPFALRSEGDLYVMAEDGSGVRRVTETPGWDGSPTWAPDGATLYYYSEQDERLGYRVFAVEPNGSAMRPVGSDDVPALAPAIGVDGRVAFSTWDQQGPNRRWRIRSVGPDGALRDEGDPGIDAFDPDIHAPSGAMVFHGSPPWEGDSIAGFDGPLLVEGDPHEVDLPDRIVTVAGTRHAFTTPPDPVLDEILYRESPRRVGLASGRGEGPSELLDLDNLAEPPSGAVSHLRYTLDGAWISFTVGPFGGPPEAAADVWRMRPDGTDLVNLTPDTPGNDGLAEFSPDGSQFVFRSGRTGNFDLYLADTEGTAPRNLTNDPARDTFPAFSPRGDQIAFVSDRNGVLDEATGRRTFDIYTLDLAPDGTPGNLRQITSNAAQDAHVGYSPDGSWLIYTSGKDGLSDESPLVQEVLFNPQMYGELYAYRLADGESIRLTHNKWEDGAPVWTTPAQASARLPVAHALTESIENEGAEVAAARYEALLRDSPMTYRFGEGGLYRTAHRYMREGNVRAASETFRILSILEPSSVRPHSELGDALMQRGDVDAATEHYQEVIARDAQNVGATWALSRAGAEGFGEVQVDTELLREYAGVYHLPQAGVTVEFSLQNGRLAVLGPGQSAPIELSALAENRFLVTAFPMEVVFVRGDGGAVTGMESRRGDGGVDRFVRVE